MATYTVLKFGKLFRVVVRDKTPDGKYIQRKLPLEATGLREAKKEAVGVFQDYLDKRNKGCDRTLVSLIKEYIEKTRLTPKTRDSYENILSKHIEPYFENKSIADLTANDFSEYYKVKEEEGTISSNTVLKHHQLIHAAYEYAINGELIEKNPTDRSKKPRKIKKDISAYTLEDYRKLYDAAKTSPIYLEIVLAMVYGLRRSEVLGLRWSCVDFEKRVIKVNLSVTRVNREFYFNEAMKTDGSIRKLELNDTMTKFLQEVRRKQQKVKETVGDFYNTEYEDFICVDCFGELHKPDYISSKFNEIIKENGFPYLTFHGLRHSFVTILLERSFPIKAVQRATGHVVVNTTLDYSDVSEEVSMNMINVTSSFLLEEGGDE